MNWIRPEIKSNPREWRRFGVAIGSVLIVLGIGLAWRYPAAATWSGGAGLLLLLSGLAAPRLLRWPYLVWMTIGLVLGTIVSTVFLCLFYLLLLTPLGLIARLRGKDFLQLKQPPLAASYWSQRDRSQPQDRARYEKQF